MIDPRKSPVAMLPILNAVAGHMIAAAAPLRVINVEDTEQMVAEAADHCGVDAEWADEAAHEALGYEGRWSFFTETEALSKRTAIGGDLGIFMSTLLAHIQECV